MWEANRCQGVTKGFIYFRTWSCGEGHAVVEAEDSVDLAEQLEEALDLGHDLEV